MIIGLTGTIGAGKSIVAEYLKSKGFVHLTYSDVIREECKKIGIIPTRENLLETGLKMKSKSKDDGILSRKLLEKMAQINHKNVIFDGIRVIAEINALSHRKDFFVIGVDADPRKRFERIKQRNRDGDAKSWNEFKRIDGRERLGLENGLEIGKCLKSADFIILNDGDTAKLKKKIDSVLMKFATDTFKY